MSKDNDPTGTRLPIKIDSASNGEYFPRPLGPHNIASNKLALERATRHSKRLGISRRSFLTSVCGAASTLLAFNEVHAAFGQSGGFFDIPKIAALETEAADKSIGKKEFIFDIQGHHVNPFGQWRDPNSPWLRFFSPQGQGSCDYTNLAFPLGNIDCFTGRAFIKEMFLDSETDIAVLSFFPTTYNNEPLTIEEAAATRDLVDALEGSQRLLLHGRVIPNLPGDMDRMDELVEQWKVAAWKTYTQYGPDLDSGWWLDDEEYGGPFIQRARELGVRVICIHKGIPLPPPHMGGKNLHYAGCRDVGPAAKQNPDMSFIIYHSGAMPGIPGFLPPSKEGPFVPGSGKAGIDSLVQSLLDNGIPPNSNVYAELGTTWREFMKDPDQAAHGIGKLLKYVGEDNVVWGTDTLWYGSPQDQIQAFRSFQISEEYQEKYDYPAITPEIRSKVFGLNAAKPYGLDTNTLKQFIEGDDMDKARAEYANKPDPTFMTYGPRTRREFLRLAALSK